MMSESAELLHLPRVARRCRDGEEQLARHRIIASRSGDDAVTSSVPVMYVPVRVASCHKVQEAMTVPSEEGGTRQVTVTRCQ